MTTTDFSPYAIDGIGVVVGTLVEFSIEVQDAAGDPADISGFTPAATLWTEHGLEIALDAAKDGSDVVVTITAAKSAQFSALNRVLVELDDGAGDVQAVGEGTIKTILRPA